MSAAMLDGNAAAELAHDANQQAAEKDAEAAVAIFGDSARAELRARAMTDADPIRDLFAEMSDADLVQMASDAVNGDLICIGRVMARLLVNHIEACANDDTDVEAAALRMYRGRA